jgi:hypothetical protein
MVENNEKMIPLGMPPDQTIGSSFNLINNATMFEILSTGSDYLKNFKFIPLTPELFQKNVEAIIPGGEFPDQLMHLYQVAGYSLYALRHPNLSDEIVLGFNRSIDKPTPKSASFSFIVTRKVVRNGDEEILKNLSTSIGGMICDSHNKLRLLNLRYGASEKSGLKIKNITMSTTPTEASRFSEPNYKFYIPLQDQFISIGLYTTFTPKMLEEVEHVSGVVFTANDDPKGTFKHLEELGTFLEKRGDNNITFGLRLFRNETTAITVPFSLREPKKPFISIRRI